MLLFLKETVPRARLQRTVAEAKKLLKPLAIFFPSLASLQSTLSILVFLETPELLFLEMIFFIVLQKALVSSLWLSINFLLNVCFALFTEFITRFRIDLYASQSSSWDDFLTFII